MLAAVREALARLPGHGPLIAAGHSAGGSLSSDYATRADGELRAIRDPVLGAHNASMGDSERVRTTFWAPLDRVIRAASG